MANNADYYTLGPKATMFWDESQPEPANKKLLRGEVKQLKETPTVSAALRAGGLDKVSKADYKDMVAAKQEADKAALELAQANDVVNSLSAASVPKEPVSADQLQQALDKLAEATKVAEDSARLFNEKVAEMNTKAAETAIKEATQQNINAVKAGETPTADATAATENLAATVTTPRKVASPATPAKPVKPTETQP